MGLGARGIGPSGGIPQFTLALLGQVRIILNEHQAKQWGRIGFDRVIVSEGGVSWLVSWPRKKLTKIYLPRITSHWLPNTGNPD